jgi:hypothetical protein
MKQSTEPKLGDNPRRGKNRAVDGDPRIGDRLPDGTIYAGISPDTNKPMHTTPADASLKMTFNAAQKYAKRLGTLFHKTGAFSHKDWRVPTKAELNVLFNNRAAVGGFDVSGSLAAGLYWSSSHADHGTVWSQRFSDGFQVGIDGPRLSVRLVRSEGAKP